MRGSERGGCHACGASGFPPCGGLGGFRCLCCGWAQGILPFKVGYLAPCQSFYCCSFAFEEMGLHHMALVEALKNVKSKFKQMPLISIAV